MKPIIFVTGNQSKQITAKRHLNDYGIEVICYTQELVEPNVNDIEYIAKSKVMQAYSMINEPCITLDAGFYISSFPGNPNFPGAFPKRELLSVMGIDGLLKIMQNIDDRKCYFKECLAYYDGNDLEIFYGLSCGHLATKQSETNCGARWSDLWSVFIPNGCSKTLAQMSDSERQTINDHSSAFEEFGKWYAKISTKTKC